MPTASVLQKCSCACTILYIMHIDARVLGVREPGHWEQHYVCGFALESSCRLENWLPALLEQVRGHVHAVLLAHGEQLQLFSF